jgi:phospholipid/cholesterol/gamma-HCH transport system ATP-binding protein
VIRIIDLKKKFPSSNNFITNGVTLEVPTGTSLCVIGLSGEGKSVLLKQIGGLLEPTSGSIILNNVNITMLREEGDISQIYKMCGYVFQFAALIDSFSVYENIAFPLIESTDFSPEEIKTIVFSLMKKTNLTENILYKYPAEISGGMKKRVGLARALALDPSIILYDEPTSGLDPINTRIIHELMRKLQLEKKITSIVVSHDLDIFNYVDKIAFLYKGKIYYSGDAKSVKNSHDPLIKQFISGNSRGPITEK